MTTPLPFQLNLLEARLRVHQILEGTDDIMHLIIAPGLIGDSRG